MDIYVFFENINVLCIFAQLVFLSGLFPGFCPVPVPRVGWFDHRFGSDNIGSASDDIFNRTWVILHW